MSSLRVWSIVVILCQTLISLIMTWWTLDCRFTPNSYELQEVTLIKLLYLYDPEACGKLYFYNITLKITNERRYRVIWPVKNNVASNFRNKVRLWLCLHVAWFILGIANLTHGHRPCGFYAALVPFTITGLTVMLVDLLYMGLFLKDVEVTNNKIAIMEYINSKSDNIKWINKPHYEYTTLGDEDTSWIALLFAYGSCRGIVQWFINFWIVKDNYIEGLHDYPGSISLILLLHQNKKQKVPKKSSSKRNVETNNEGLIQWNFFNKKK